MDRNFCVALGLGLSVNYFSVLDFQFHLRDQGMGRGVVLRLGRMLPEAKGAGLSWSFIRSTSSLAFRCGSRPSMCRRRT